MRIYNRQELELRRLKRLIEGRLEGVDALGRLLDESRALELPPRNGHTYDWDGDLHPESGPEAFDPDEARRRVLERNP